MAEPFASSFAGKRVVITRPKEQSARLVQALQAAQFEPVLLPLLRIEPPARWEALDGAIANLEKFDWLIFTSQNAVTAFVARMSALALALSAIPTSLQIAVVGKATAERAVELGLGVSRFGKGRSAADLVSELARELPHKKVLLPRGDLAPHALVQQLQQAGAHVSEVAAYRTVAVDYSDEDEVPASADAILFFSPSAVNAFVALAKSGILSSVRQYGAVGCIGPVTRAALLDGGLPCDFEAPESSAQQIVAALKEFMANHDKQPASTAEGPSR